MGDALSLQDMREIINVQEAHGTTVYKLAKTDMLWLLDQAEKYQELTKAWKDETNETTDFLRVCKAIIDGVEVPKRNKRT